VAWQQVLIKSFLCPLVLMAVCGHTYVYSAPTNKTLAKKTESKIVYTLPNDHKVYEQLVQSLKKGGLSLDQLDQFQSKALTQTFRSTVGSLDEEFVALAKQAELEKFLRLVASGRNKDSILSISRALSNISPLKWVTLFTEKHARALDKVCKAKSVKEDCNYWVTRLRDVFPKGANELVDLKFQPDESKTAAFSSGRLSQTYTEKTEKDETLLKEIVAAFVKQDYSESTKLSENFLADYPRSTHQFRVRFLLGESLHRKGRVDQAKPHFEEIMKRAPWSWYAILSAERLSVSLPNTLLAVSLKPGSSAKQLGNSKQGGTDKANAIATGFSYVEEMKFQRLQSLVHFKKREGAYLEIDSFSRLRNYSDDGILSLLQEAVRVKDHPHIFRLITELIQRESDKAKSKELIDLIFPVDFEKEFKETAKNQNIDWTWVLSLSKQESAFYPRALSGSGALGLMQLMTFTALEVNSKLYLRDLFNPKTNIETGTGYLVYLLKRFNGNLVYSLAGYNAGPTRLGRWRKDVPENAGMIEFIESIPVRETKDYVTSILRNIYWYRHRLGLSPFKSTDAWVESNGSVSK
jgi:TolA-binding protein